MHKVIFLIGLSLLLKQSPVAAQSGLPLAQHEEIHPADDQHCGPEGRTTASVDEPHSSSVGEPVRSSVLQSVAVKQADLTCIGDSDSGTDKAIQPVVAEAPNPKVRWAEAIGESLLFTGVMHTFNVWTEPGTRDALNGHWFRNYIDSVSELRGWSDSDKFMAPYIGHTLEGSIFGYTFRENDPRYRNVQWGDGRTYFVSLLRSMAWSAVWHTQWKIGPVSEASIGNVMLHASPGFITLVDTPTLGTVEMIAEDAADRYLIVGLENHTTNRAIIILVRSFLNPGRTFANIMAFQVPWRRDTRLPLFRNDAFEVRKELVRAYQAGKGEKPFVYVHPSSDANGVELSRTYPKEASIELSAYPYYENFGGRNCVGGGGSGAARASPSLQIVVEVNGCLVKGFSASNESGDSLFYGGGPRWTPRASHRLSPYGEFLFGGRKVTYEVDNPALHAQLLKEWNDGSGTLGHDPKRSDWSVETANNGVSIAVGGGLDVVVTRPFAWRVINMQYTHSWMGDVGTMRPQNGIRITTEAVLRIGTW
jgi:hypothetical protein